MLHAHTLTRRALVALVLTSAGCGDDKGISASGFVSSFTASQGSQSSNETNTAGETVGATDTAVTDDTAAPVTTTGEVSATEPDPTTTGVDPTATTMPDPSTTTGVDPSTTTGVDPSTTTGMTTEPPDTTDSGDETTDDPPPPVKDPQPVNGLYETCLDNTPCEAALTDGCFTITDAMTMKVIDGYCTILCNAVADCGPKPNAPAVQECLSISLNPVQKVCALKCNGVADCPTGMACTGLALPNNAMGSYCT
jgi:hypothetical protein